jgi:tetratricopeptide (TPR) repeat protein
MKSIVVLLLIMVLQLSAEAQRPGKAYRTGKQAFDNKEYIRATGWLSIAIDAQKAKFNDAYIIRAQSYEALNRTDEAIKDYIAATKLFPDRADVTLKTARLLYKLKNYNEALQYATATLDIDTASFEAMKIQSLALTNMGNAESGLLISDQASQLQEDAEVLYAKALASDSLGLIDYAIAYYNEAISINKSFKPPYHDMGRLLVRNGYYDKAIEIFTQATKEFNDPTSYKLRSLIYGFQGNTLAQINDLTKILTLEPTSISLYFDRAEQYKKVNLLQNALSDITYYIEWDPYSASAWLLKGQILEELYMISKAIEAFQNVIKYSDYEEHTDYSKNAIFRLKKEKFPPQINIISPPGPDASSISLGKDQSTVLIKGTIEDASKIERILVNGFRPDTTINSKLVEFSIQLTLDTSNYIHVVAADIYQNTVSKSYKILRVEKEPPLLHLIEPKLSADSSISVTASQLNIKGFFYDFSGLKWIRINGKKIQPQIKDDKFYFSDKLNGVNNDSLIIEASDYFSNEISYKYKLRYNDTLKNVSSPLGKTWYVLIVNDSIEDVLPEIRRYKEELIANLGHFKVDSVVVLSSLSKENIERSLLFKLPEAFRNNRVEAMILHVVSPGITKGEFTYWITPSSFKKDKYSLLNVSILRTFFNAIKFLSYKTILSESVSIPSNITLPITNCECVDCNSVNSYPENGQFVMSIKVSNWHTYNSPYLKILKESVNKNDRCFSLSKFFNNNYKEVVLGSLKGSNATTFPVIMYMNK